MEDILEIVVDVYRESALELLQRHSFILSGSLIKKVIMPPGSVSLEDVDLHQVSVDSVVNCAKKGTMLELSEAITDYDNHTELPQMNNTGSADEFFLVTAPGSSGSPPKRAPPLIPAFTPSAHLPPVSTPPPIYAPPPVYLPSLIESTLSESESFSSMQVKELNVDDIEDFEDNDMLENVDSARPVRRNPNDACRFCT